MIEVAKARPPFVTFELRPEEDRQASIDSGSARFRDVEFAIITPAGSKDRVERKVADWFQHLEREVQSERFPIEWLNHFKEKFKAWKEGRELPVDGTALARWPVITPAQLKDLQGLHLRSVEDLASANEEVIRRLGMGGRALKQQAVEWLAAANDVGKVAARVAALEASKTDQEQIIKDLTERNEKLAKELEVYRAAQAAAAKP